MVVRGKYWRVCKKDKRKLIIPKTESSRNGHTQLISTLLAKGFKAGQNCIFKYGTRTTLEDTNHTVTASSTSQCQGCTSCDAPRGNLVAHSKISSRHSFLAGILNYAAKKPYTLAATDSD
eukprot:Em0179g23a